MTPEPSLTDLLGDLLAEQRATRAALERLLGVQDESRLLAHPTADPRLTVAEAAKYASTHDQTIRQACRLRELEHERRGQQGQIRIRLSQLERWLSRDRVRARRGA